VRRRKLTPAKRAAVFARDGRRCRICGTSARGTAFEIDHILPVSRGGDDSLSNLRVSCRPCNQRRWNHFPLDAPEVMVRSWIADLYGTRVAMALPLEDIRRLLRKLGRWDDATEDAS
jgi:5-methylcytosine-specific restriction endonuclease McrA